MSYLLCIETSTEVCSVSIVKEGKVIDLIEDSSGLNHSKFLTVFINQILERNSIKPEELSAIAVSEGPGSYTGLRIGVSAAKGICYGVGIPLIAVSPLAAMADELVFSASKYDFACQENDQIVPMIDARRMEVYSGIYSCTGKMNKEVDAVIVDSDSFKEELAQGRLIFIGNGAGKCKPTIISQNAVFVDGVITSAINMARIAQRKFDANEFVDVAYFEPFYLKNFVATTSKKSVFGD